MIKVEAIIATKDRADSCLKLVNQILKISFIEGIIIIDSSEKDNASVFQLDRIKYYHCTIKNQPFQRYLGYRLSSAEILFFFDDDVRITDANAVKELLKYYENFNAVGAGFELELFRNNPGSSNSKSRVNPLIGLFKKLYPGEYWIAGIKRNMPNEEAKVDYLKGPAFSARRSALYKNFNFQLFSLYEKKIGKGEDTILTYTLTKQGDVYYNPVKPLVHIDTVASNYAKTIIGFYRKYGFSRFYHTLEFNRLNNKNVLFRIFSLIFYYIFMISAATRSFLEGIIGFSSKKILRSVGLFQGSFITLFFPLFVQTRSKSKKYWENKIEIILKEFNSNNEEVSGNE